MVRPKWEWGCFYKNDSISDTAGANSREDAKYSSVSLHNLSTCTAQMPPPIIYHPTSLTSYYGDSISDRVENYSVSTDDCIRVSAPAKSLPAIILHSAGAHRSRIPHVPVHFFPHL